MMKNLNNKTIISVIKDKTKDSVYDYLVNFNSDREYSIVHFVKSDKDIEWNKEGWHLWVVDEPDEELKSFYPENGCLFIQTATGNWGTDYHFLTDDEINLFILFFSSNNIEWNNIKNK